MGGGNEIRTELGNEIAPEETRAAKDGRDVPRDRTTPGRAIRDDWRAVGQDVYSTLELQGKKDVARASQHLEGVRGCGGSDGGVHTLPVGAAARGNRTKVASMWRMKSMVSSSDLLCWWAPGGLRKP